MSDFEMIEIINSSDIKKRNKELALDISKYYENPKNMFGYGRCVSPWLTAELMPNGDVALCRDYPDYKIGNITQDSILNIFNSEKAKKFRQVLKEEGGLFPICARCCGLMGW